MIKVQFITAATGGLSHLDGARQALEGGCKWIQLRMKDSERSERLAVATKMKRMCAKYGAVLIIDDDVETAKDIDADGVHLGKNDMPISEARAILGERFIIGGTANSFDDIVKIYRDGGDYVGCGPFRFTTTKKNLSPILGIDGYKAIVARMRETGINIPMVAIGGITADDITDIAEAGITQFAISGAILNARSPKDEMRKIINLSLK